MVSAPSSPTTAPTPPPVSQGFAGCRKRGRQGRRWASLQPRGLHPAGPPHQEKFEGNQPGSAERPWLRMNLRVFGLRPASGPRPQRSRGESRSPPAARRRRQPGTAWARGGWCEETQSERQNLLGAAFWRFLYRPPGWLRAFCRQPGAPAHPAPRQLPHIAPFLLRARLRGE